MNLIPDWKPKVEVAARQALKRALYAVGAKNLCGFALYTDESAMSLSVTINTEDNFREAAGNSPPGENVYSRWSPPEWFEEGFADELFDDINRDLLSIFEHDHDDSEFEIFAGEFFEECVRALENVRQDLPPDINENFVMVFDISDYDDINQMIQWVKRLNNSEKAREFKKAYS